MNPAASKSSVAPPSSATLGLAALEMRQLALMDRIIALEVENARLRIAVGQPSRSLTNTTTWRVGSAIVGPFAALRRLVTRKR